jgi:putative restriction endonuclease
MVCRGGLSELDNPIRPKDFMDEIRPLLEAKYAPLQQNGHGLQQVYLTEISKQFGELMIAPSRVDLPAIQKELAVLSDPESDYEIELEIHTRQFEGNLEKIERTISRRGQGIFKANVR